MGRRKDGGCHTACDCNGLRVSVRHVRELFNHAWGSVVESCGSAAARNGQQNMPK